MSVLVGRAAPAFSAEAAINGGRGTVSLSDYRGKKYVVLFFYPANFTDVCHSELLAFQEQYSDFSARDVQLLACSADGVSSHLSWLKRPRAEGGIEGVCFPLIGDEQRAVAGLYEAVAADNTLLRALYIIDPKGLVRYQSVNELAVGRGIGEVLRCLDAIIHVDKYGRLCPANWKPGQDSMASKIRNILSSGNTNLLSKTAKPGNS